MPNTISSQANTLSAQEKAERYRFTPDRNHLPKNIKVQERGEQTLDKNSYLKLLVTELSRQDPLNPVNDKEFISQMAQFSALEQMQNVATSVNGLKNFQATSLVGKIVSGQDFVHHKEIRGKVDGIIFDGNGEAILRVDGKTMRLKDVKGVSEPLFGQQEIPPAYPKVSRETMSAPLDKSPNQETTNAQSQEARRQQGLREYSQGQQPLDAQSSTNKNIVQEENQMTVKSQTTKGEQQP